jgi:colicin import membrane protein
VYVGLLVSVLMHAGLLGWTVISIQSTPELRAPLIEPVAVDMITPSELTRLTKGSREATLKEARPKDSQQADPAPKEGPRPRPITAAPPPPPPPEPPAQAPDSPPPPPPPKVAAATPPPPPPPPAVEPPKPEPDKAALEQKLADLAALQQVEEAKLQAEAKAKAEADAKAQADAAAKAKAEAEAKAKAEAAAKAKAEADAKAKAEADAKRIADAKAKADLKRKQDEKRRADAERKRIAAEKEKAKFSADRLSALLDKSPDPRAPAPAAPDTQSDTRAKGPVLGAPEGRDATLSASARAMLGQLMRESVKRCWNINAGLDGIDKIGVRIEIRLARNGSLADQPKILNSGNSPLFRDMADSALRAIIACAPYTLPPDMYEGGWDHMIMNFDPSQMF